MVEIRWTVGSEKDLLEIVEYISQDSLMYAASTANRIISAVERLQSFPQSGRIVPEYLDDHLMEIIIGNYRIVYEIKSNNVTILAVVHASRNLFNLTLPPAEGAVD